MLRRILCLVVPLIICHALPLRAQVSLPDPETFDELGINELLDLGGGPTGWWAMQGMPWTISELLRRDRDTVVQEAYRRLGGPAGQEYSHAFMVNLLRQINPAGLDDNLARLYSSLDPRGRYEVLLRAWDSGNPVYIPLVSGLFEQAGNGRLDKEIIVGAFFAIRARDTGLLESVIAHFRTLDEATLGNPAIRNLDGFPYSDVVIRPAPDIPGFIAFAEDVLDFTKSLTSEPSMRELDLLETTRRALLEPERSDIDVEAGLISDFQRHLAGEYSLLAFEALPNAYRRSSIHSNFSASDATYQEIMARLCNDEALSFYGSTQQFFTWSTSIGNYNSLSVSRPCITHRGILIQLSANYREDGGALQFSVNTRSPVGWLDFNYANNFILESITDSASGEQLALESRSFRRLTTIDLGDTTPEEIGPVTIAGQLEFYIPSMIRIIEIDVAGRESLELTRDLMFLRFTDEREQVLLEWGMDTACCSRFGEVLLPYVSSGIVQVYDSAGTLHTRVKGIGTSPQVQSTLRVDKIFPVAWEPARLVWTYAPVMEKLTIPVVFEDITFTRNTDLP